ncbi:hypothetical protein F2Q68_00016816 [Brassica cretica]|uniref:Uncharacterized protein n=1 Tax=Brassica cretica TaxID=69181 RepID=A0A8S9HM89_BRACR|nr:hypothetical protein F2Q68_00016816 [Brassica cretica]
MSSRRSNSRYSDRVRTRTGSANAERIRSGDVSDALTEVLREETRLPRLQPKGPKIPRVKNLLLVLSRVTQRVRRGVIVLQRRLKRMVRTIVLVSRCCSFSEALKPAGCPLPSLRNMTEREAYVKMVVAHAKAMEANNEFAATLEKRLQDVPRSDELYEIKKVVRELKLGLKMAQDRERANAAQLATAEKLGNQAASLEARLRVVSNERKSALEQVSFLEAKDCPITEDLDSVAHFVRHFKPAGCPLPALRNMTERET